MARKPSSSLLSPSPSPSDQRSPFPSQALISQETVDPDMLLHNDLVSLDDSFLLSLRSSSRQKIALLTDKAVRTLSKGMDSGDLKIAIAAANSILDRDGLSKPQSIFSDDSSFSPSVVLGALLGAAKVMGVPLDESSARRTLMEVEAKDGRSSVSVSLASETSPSPPPTTTTTSTTSPSSPPSDPVVTMTPSVRPASRAKRAVSSPTTPTNKKKKEDRESPLSEIPSELLESLSKDKQ